uniref:BED-type domain-containing protein n=2 Tax=Ceratitis capitata TaxID=7213 RepID=W8CBF5_CERCA
MSVGMGRVRNKKIWLYFDRISDYAARCKNCKLNLSCKHTSANLVRHLYYKHHVDASYYGAERTGFLKHKRGRINRSSVNLASSYLQSGTNTNDSLEPLEVIKQEIVPMELVRCNRSDEDADGEDDTHSTHDYQRPILPIPSPSQISPLAEEDSENINDIYDVDAQLVKQPGILNTELYLNNPQFKEKLLAETRYFNEMAELARAKRIMIELQSKKLILELETMRTS